MSIDRPQKGSSYYTLIQHLTKELFVGEQRRIRATISKLIEDNNEIRGVSAIGFYYNGDRFTTPDFKSVPGSGTFATLDDSLVPRMDKLERSSHKLANEESLIGQAVYLALTPCTTLQEMRNTLPDCMADMLPALKDLERTGSVGCSLEDNPRAHGQFMEYLPRIEFYSAARLIY